MFLFVFIVPLFKGKGDRFECFNYRGISMLSMVGKVDGALGKEGRGCVDQVFYRETVM